MEPVLRTINAVISALFFICYTYQFLYIPLVLLKKRRPLPRPAASTEMRNARRNFFLKGIDKERH